MMHTNEISIASPAISAEEIKAVERVLRSGMLAQGENVRQFEEQFASYVGTRHAVAVNSGTAALHVALLVCGIGKGDEVITTPFTFIATANAIVFCGAKPVFADVEEDTFNINPDLIEARISPRTKAIIPVHLYGQPCDMHSIMEICRRHDLALIEDACQAVGGECEGRKVGSFGIGCFSFYPTKNITTGEGGMITTNDTDSFERARMIRTHGQKERYVHEMLGYNYRMTDMAAAIGICQLAKLDYFNNTRIKNAAYLTKALKAIKGIITPSVRDNLRHVFHQYTIRVLSEFGTTRDALKEKLAEAGIATGIYYPMPIHKQPVYRSMGYRDNLPISEKFASEVLSLPVHPGLTREDLDRIVNGIQNIQNGHPVR